MSKAYIEQLVCNFFQPTHPTPHSLHHVRPKAPPAPTFKIQRQNETPFFAQTQMYSRPPQYQGYSANYPSGYNSEVVRMQNCEYDPTRKKKTVTQHRTRGLGRERSRREGTSRTGEWEAGRDQHYHGVCVFGASLSPPLYLSGHTCILYLLAFMCFSTERM